MVRVDIGCGNRKTEGFIGVDRYDLPGVDIVADLNHSLPFRDNSLDLVLCSHSLEHVDNLHKTISEIYRICRHRAQVCIIAPYGLESLANPFHRQVFNEHTPRFWTDNPATPLDPAEYEHPHAGNDWGLATSDNSPAEMDFRCLRMEFFYFPEYRHLSMEEQRRARKKYLNVCDTIMYHLIVVKEPISEGDMEEITKSMDYYEPPGIIIRKLQERSEFLEEALRQAHTIIASREAELADLKKRLEEKDESLHVEVSRNKGLEAEVVQLKEMLALEARRFEEAKGDVESIRGKLAEAMARQASREAEIGQFKTALATREAELADIRKKFEERDAKLNAALIQNKGLEAEVIQVKTMLAWEARRFEEAKGDVESIRGKLAEAMARQASREAEIGQFKTALATREAELADIRKKFEERDAKLNAALIQNKGLEAELVQVKEILSRRERDMENVRSTLESREAEINQVRTILTTRDAEIEEAHSMIRVRARELDLFREKAKTITTELDLFRHRKTTRFVTRFFNKSDLRNDLLPTFLQLKDDSFMFNKNLKGFRLLPSKNLQRLPFVYYPLELDRPNLKGILVAPIMDFPSVNGVLGIEIVSSDGNVVAHSVVPASQISETLPTRFDFPPIQNSDRGRFWLRVFVRDVDYPVRIFEWKKHGFFRFGPPQTRAFCGFIFENVT